MENHLHNKFMLKVSRLLPSSFSSCHFRTLPDVADSSITIHQNHPSSFHPPKKLLSDAEGRKCPPVTPTSSTLNPNQKRDNKVIHPKSFSININQSSSSHSAWFSSGDENTRNRDVETDTFFSLSSNSGDSFRLKTSRRFRKCHEMKSIDETSRCSYDIVLSPKTAKTTGKVIKMDEKRDFASDHVSTQLYYTNTTGDSIRRRKTARTRRKTRKNSSRRRVFDGSVMIGESYAVEKRSSDPRSDFRESMVEMIVEKQMFGGDDLEKLLRCFLSLNAVSYHGMICDVFSEICETLFTN
ncbi:hypothetical protein BUALT_Bualt10G0111500 [Buddleja alternifolia]|uniref:Transcription repressor n=1 Tax=Buddleja alternifolia TaxID=168488 RepID=A0AAV6WZK0_9LAMI|nr:hypothetical protein BUALT_Bualt10G0111500 [Buddleja alternifolia]